VLAAAAADIDEGMAMARASVSSGAALAALDALRRGASQLQSANG